MFLFLYTIFLYLFLTLVLSRVIHVPVLHNFLIFSCSCSLSAPVSVLVHSFFSSFNVPRDVVQRVQGRPSFSTGRREEPVETKVVMAALAILVVVEVEIPLIITGKSYHGASPGKFPGIFGFLCVVRLFCIMFIVVRKKWMINII